MALFDILNSTKTDYYFEEGNFSSANIPRIYNPADTHQNWILPLIETPYQESNTSYMEQASVSAILEKCRFQLLEQYPTFENFSDVEKHIAICDYCYLDDNDLNILYSDLTCVHTVYYPVPVFCVLFGLVFLLGLVGNVLVISGVRAGGRALSSVMHLFIANVAVGDLLIVLFCLPFTVTSIMVLHYWPFGKALCVGVSYLQVVSVFVSSYSLVAVSFDRYMAIIYPLRPRIARRTAKVAIGIIWILAFATGIPAAYYSKLVVPTEGYHQHHNLPVCHEVWPEDYQELRRIYSLVLLSLHYFLPVAVMVFTYTRIAHRVWCSKESRAAMRYKASVQLSYSFSTTIGTLQRQSSSTSTKEGGPHSPHSPTSTPGQSPVKLISMTVTVVSVYSLCWLPFNVLMVLQEYRPDIHNMTGFHYLWAGCYFLAMLHTVFNVILLYWLNPVFRYSVLKLLCKLFPCCRASLENRLQRLSSSRFHRKNTFTNSYGGVNTTVTVRQSGSLQRRYHCSPSDRGNSVTRTLSNHTVDETISLSPTPRVSNNYCVSNDLSTLHEMSSDTVFDPDATPVVTTSFVTLSTLTANRRSDEACDPLLARPKDTVTTDDDDSRSEMGDRANRGTFSDTDEVFLPDQQRDFGESTIMGEVDPDSHFTVSQIPWKGDEVGKVMDAAAPSDAEGFHQRGNSGQEEIEAGTEYEFDRNQTQENHININNYLHADLIGQREVSLRVGFPDDEVRELLERESTDEWDDEELILPDTIHLRTIHEMKLVSSTRRTTSAVQNNSRSVTVSEKEATINSSASVVKLPHNTNLQREASTRYAFVLQQEQFSENSDGVEL